jgi:hypothetical protein
MKANNLKLRILFVVSILALLALVSAASAFMYFVEPINNTINKDQSATFKLTIENTLTEQDFYTISTRDVHWIVTPQVTDTVNGKEEISVIITLTPKQFVTEGRAYFVPVKIRSAVTDSYREDDKKFGVIVTSGAIDYVRLITPNVLIDNIVDPREKIAVKINLKNWMPKDYNDLKITIDGEEFSREYTTNLLGLEDKTNEILFEVNPLLSPGKRTLTLMIYSEEVEAPISVTSEYEILGYVDMKESVQKDVSLFRTKQTVIITNNGNLAGIAEHSFSAGCIKRMFTKFSPEAVKEKGIDGNTYYVVREKLGPQQSIEITADTNYRLLVTIILFLIICWILYMVFRSPIIIVKKADPVGKTVDGLSEIKVRIYMKNRSRKPTNNIRVIDTVPSIVDLEKSKHLGSMEPVNVSKGTRGTIAKWEFESLEPYEERVIAYNIKSKLKLIGGIRLPHAKARFEAKKGQERVTYSNGVNLVYKQQFSDE